MPSRQDRLDEKPIDRLITIGERGEIDLAIPAVEQFVVRDETVRELVVQEEARAGSTLLQAASGISRHNREIIRERRSAGNGPGMRQ